MSNATLARLLAPSLASFFPSFTQGHVGAYAPTSEGSTTPGVTTYTTQQGSWVRLGPIVIVTGTVVWTAASGTGTALISLPSIVANVANQNFSGSARTVNVTFANSAPQVLILPNTAFFQLSSPLTNAAPAAVAVEAAGNIVFTVVYRAE